MFRWFPFVTKQVSWKQNLWPKNKTWTHFFRKAEHFSLVLGADPGFGSGGTQHSWATTGFIWLGVGVLDPQPPLSPTRKSGSRRWQSFSTQKLQRKKKWNAMYRNFGPGRMFLFHAVCSLDLMCSSISRGKSPAYDKHHTHESTQTHAHRQADRQTDRQTDRQADRQADTHTHTRAHTHRHTHTETHTHSPHTHTRMHTRTHAHTRIHTRTHTHTHTHSCPIHDS